MRILVCLGVLMIGVPWVAVPAGAAPPVSGLPVPELQPIEDAVLQLMAVNEIGAASIAVARHGVPIYSRAFGWQDRERTIPLAPNAMMRLASVTKPFTASAVRKLVAENRIQLDDRVFSLSGQTGLLNHEPFGTPDPRLREVTVDHLLRHRGGWDRDAPGVPDLTYQETRIASEMGLPSPPGRDATIRWIMGQDLQSAPGAERHYSNVGYLLLGKIVEEVTSKKLIDFLSEDVLTPRPNFPAPQLVHGRTFQADHDPREPYYESDVQATNVFAPSETVQRPYGGWDHEARIGQGAIVADAMTVLDLLGRHQVSGDNIGGPRPAPGNWRRNHTGSFAGTNTLARQRGDGIDYVVLFNMRSSNASFGSQIRGTIDAILDSGQITSWPTTPITSFQTSMPGDYNHDGVVNAADYTAWRDSPEVATRVGVGADGNGDGVIDPDDYGLWAASYGLQLPQGTASSTGGPTYPVPEPAWSYLAACLLASPFLTAAR